MRSALKQIEDMVLDEFGDEADQAVTDVAPAPAKPDATSKPKAKSKLKSKLKGKLKAQPKKAEDPEQFNLSDTIGDALSDSRDQTNTWFAEKTPYGSVTASVATGPVLILGSTGSFGTALAMELIAQGGEVRMLVRDARRASLRYGKQPNVKLMKGDVFDVNAVARAIDGCEAIIHAVNFSPSQWDPHLVRATESIISAAEMSGSLVVFPGSTHALGKPAKKPLPETAPYKPFEKYGKVRAHIQELFETASTEGRIRSLILRMSDLFGPTVRNPLVDEIFSHALEGKPMTMYGNPQAPHYWCYMPDVAKVVVEMMRMARSAHCFDSYEIINAPGHIFRPQKQLYEMIAESAGKHCKIDHKSWTKLKIKGLNSTWAKEMVAMRHLWDEGVLLDDEKLTRLFPQFQPTPLREAIATTLASYRL